ncbi:MAG: hypothetical protein B6I24_04855 [Bacteroidetes bacterium 4572_128]|nr:MAG: hypothetical protein B6I24_04855 [Bacteroidetes bacterium 4572_128]
MKVEVIASRLNVRNIPNGNRIGSLKKGHIFEIVEEKNSWIKFSFRSGFGYVSSDYVKKISFKVKIKTKLNVRDKEINGNILGTYEKGDIVKVYDKIGDWYKVKYKNKNAFIHSGYTSIFKSDNGFLYQNEKLNTKNLIPSKLLKLPDSSKGKMVAGIYNKYGGLMEDLSKAIDVDLATAIAVFSVESGGLGFRGDKMIIRFEIHLFHRYWGVHNEKIFNKHFKFSHNKKWKEHKFCKNGDNVWTEYHRNQTKEWEVLEFARKLDNELAIKSISMGAPQIMGSNYKMIGYENVEKMFLNFNKNIKFHIFGFFDFLDKRMKKALKAKDFSKFASYYNGSGQANFYGKKIKEYYDTFHEIS